MSGGEDAANGAPRAGVAAVAIGHRPGLDGLRGLAVLAVVAFHGGTGLVGGALGVDLFLVLSGFLITGHLAAELDGGGGIALGRFWARRVRRLVPALLLLVTVVVVVGVTAEHLLGGYPVDGLRGDALATLADVANWRYVLDGGDYFDGFGAPSPLRHTWSLAVEEQWYLLWPLVLWALHRCTRGRTGPLAAAIVAVAAGSAALMWWLAADVDRAHYGTDTRAQGLLVGAAVAVVVRQRPVEAWRAATTRAVGLAGWAGLAVTSWMVARVGGSTPWLYRGGHLLIAVAGAAVTTAALVPGTRLTRLLSLSWLRAAGLASYGLYLWHWPVFVWLGPTVTGLDRWPLFAVRLAVSALAAAVSYAIVEQPIRRGRLPVRRPVSAGLAATAACAAVAVVAVAIAGPTPATGPLAVARPDTPPAGFARAVPVAAGIQAVAAVDARHAVAAAAQAPPAGPLDAPLPPGPADGRLDIAVIGDSTAFTLAADAPRPGDARITNGGVIACGLDPAPARTGDTMMMQDGLPVPCPQAADLWLYRASEADADVVVLLLGAWEVFDRTLPDGTELRAGSHRWREWLATGLEGFGQRLAVAAPHARIVVADVPCFRERDLGLGGTESPRNDHRRVAAVNEVLDEFVRRHPSRVTAWSLSSVVCAGTVPREAIDGVTLRPDGVHVTGPSAALVWERELLPHLRRLVAGPVFLVAGG